MEEKERVEKFDIDTLRRPADLDLPDYRADRLVNDSVAREALYEIGEKYMESLRRNQFHLGWQL